MSSALLSASAASDTSTQTEEYAVLAAAENILKRKLQRQGGIRNPMDAADYLRIRLGGLPHEEFHVLWLDSRHCILDCQRLFMGTIDGASIYPREVVRAALDVNASAAILVHNHPSGATDPSAADRIITKELQDALRLISVRVLDHLIVGAECVSMASLGYL
ncbi:JAB domain-containing protein [Dyella flagellata]|uniref:RadC family protein n=1 Tax=Dyella flagellata TaxID=1867833 RepID=A0ABQ5X9G7_9GAMM|nr:JAB domain-containing protein [Dyella flagellata]GLQ87238.1 RadC family protein [Dyella flagellata]